MLGKLASVQFAVTPSVPAPSEKGGCCPVHPAHAPLPFAPRPRCRSPGADSRSLPLVSPQLDVECPGCDRWGAAVPGGGLARWFVVLRWPQRGAAVDWGSGGEGAQGLAQVVGSSEQADLERV